MLTGGDGDIRLARPLTDEISQIEVNDLADTHWDNHLRMHLPPVCDHPGPSSLVDWRKACMLASERSRAETCDRQVDDGQWLLNSTRR